MWVLNYVTVCAPQQCVGDVTVLSVKIAHALMAVGGGGGLGGSGR